ncbi:MAG: hypothetical protein FGM61_12565 [Sediminibacterium sp.]|nr:hypothetical protein [Sediminibacterium sp.]
MKAGKEIETVDQYCMQYPLAIQQRLAAIRAVIKKLAPEATEKISYRMPLYMLGKRLLYFAVHTHHIGLYPMASGIQQFANQLDKYVHATGSVQFPHNQPLPISLIQKMIAFRIKENREKATKPAKKNNIKPPTKKSIKKSAKK